MLAVEEPRFVWLDVSQPSDAELAQVAAEHDLHPSAVKDCLQPEHLAKHERIGRYTFLIARAFDEAADPGADTVHRMTRKIALFFCDGFVLTIHRADMPWFEELKRTLPASLSKAEPHASQVVLGILMAVLETYRLPLEEAEKATGRFEETVFASQSLAGAIRDVYLVKRRITVIRWMVRHSLEVIQKLVPPSERAAPLFHDLKEVAEGLYFAADELLDDVNTLLTMQLSLASHDTNEVMRVLTVLSVFFMPLTFIVGVYGMNFEHMPELKHPLGYLGAWAVMVAVTVGIYLWFRRKGWLR